MQETGSNEKDMWLGGIPRRSEEEIKKAREREQSFNSLPHSSAHPDTIVKRMGFDLFKGDNK